VLCITNLSAAKAASEGMEWMQKHQITLYGALKNRM
jgi:hypothetical protein